jgi:hypothetical protein
MAPGDDHGWRIANDRVTIQAEEKADCPRCAIRCVECENRAYLEGWNAAVVKNEYSGDQGPSAGAVVGVLLTLAACVCMVVLTIAFAYRLTH